jgi:AraC-like DNA-binding protein/mannose-6-phosphate isomerase-like protein (cupin superfamily)
MAQQQSQDSDWTGWENLTPVLRHANFFDAAPGGGFGPRYLQDFQILVMQAGQGTITINGISYDLAPGDAVFYGPNERHQVTSSVDDPLRLAGIHFVLCAEDEKQLRPEYKFGREVPLETGIASSPLSPAPAPKISVGLRSEVHRLIEALILSYFMDATGRQLEKRGLILQLLQAWHDATPQPSADLQNTLSARHRQSLSACEQALLANLRQPASSAELAAMADLSEGYFNALFKRYSGYTVGAFVTRHRLLEARRLLVQGQLSVKEVAYQVGFHDQFHFSRLFARTFGVAPSRLRNRKPE